MNCGEHGGCGRRGVGGFLREESVCCWHERGGGEVGTKAEDGVEGRVDGEGTNGRPPEGGGGAMAVGLVAAVKVG